MRLTLTRGRSATACHRVLALAVALTAMFALPLCSRARARSLTQWRTPGFTSCVAWSPKGDRIAYVVDGPFDDGFSLLRADIWVAHLNSVGRLVRPRRLARLTRRRGIPVALFWLSDDRLGWASAHYSERTPGRFGFVKTRLNDHKKTRRPLSGTFDSYQVCPSMEQAFGGPDDVYYDRTSRSLLFSGGIGAGVYAKILSVATGHVRRLSLSGVSPLAPVTLCGLLRSRKGLALYVAAARQQGPVGSGAFLIWLSRSYSLRTDKVLVNPPNYWVGYPRISPGAGTLAYESDRSKWGGIMLLDLRTGKSVSLAHYSPQHVYRGASFPAMGCPFSWSPDGKKIAYADGSKIKIVKVPKGF